MTNSVFISYRREVGSLWALALYQELTRLGIDTFYDIESVTESGQFDTRIFEQIGARPYFLLVLTPGTLDRCAQPADWLRKEIGRAHAMGRTVVPMFTEGFDFADIDRFLGGDPDVAAQVSASHGVQLDTMWFKEGVAKLVGQILKPVPATALPPPTPQYFERAARAAREADRAPTVTPEQLAHQARIEQARQREVVGEPTRAPGSAPSGPSGRSRLVIAISVAAAVVLAVVALVLVLRDRGGGDDTEGTETTLAPARDRLDADDTLVAGEPLTSGPHTLEITASGDLRATTDGTEWWRHDGVAGAWAIMQDDGNFVFYEPPVGSSEAPIWSSGTQQHPGAHLELGDDDGTGFVAIYAADGRLRWRQPPSADDPSPEPSVDTTASPPSTVTTSSTIDPATIETVHITDFAFEPDDLSINVGQSVRWLNDDATTHRVVATDGTFDSGNIAAGDEWTHTFSVGGSYDYSCTIHPSMTGTVTAFGG